MGGGLQNPRLVCMTEESLDGRLQTGVWVWWGDPAVLLARKLIVLYGIVWSSFRCTSR